MDYQARGKLECIQMDPKSIRKGGWECKRTMNPVSVHVQLGGFPCTQKWYDDGQAQANTDRRAVDPGYPSYILQG